MKRQNKTSEHGPMSADVNSWFTSAQLALLGGERVIDIPRSERWAGDKAKKLKWAIRRVEGGGGPGGMRTEYQPPEGVLAQIHAFLEVNPDFFGTGKKAIINHSIGYGKTMSSGPLVSGSGKQAGLKLQDHRAAPETPSAPEGFVLVPRYDVSASMGNGAVIHSEQVVDHLAFRAEWVRTELGTSPRNLILISAIGDSMEPSLRAGDLLLIDRSVESVKQDSIYAIAHDGELRIKRIQRLFDGSLVIKSDNPNYRTEELSPAQAEQMRIVGRVVWSGRRM